MLKECKVWKAIDCPTNHKVIKNWWIFDVKFDGCKCACLVVKSFSYIKGIDYDQIFSSVVQFETVQCMLTLATLQNRHISRLDVWSAYLYGILEEELYMEFPEGLCLPI